MSSYYSMDKRYRMQEQKKLNLANHAPIKELLKKSKNMKYLKGSICLEDLKNIPANCYKEVTCKNGKIKHYLNCIVVPIKSPRTFGAITNTHTIMCKSKQDEKPHYFGNFSIVDNITNKQDNTDNQQNNDDWPY